MHAFLAPSAAHRWLECTRAPHFEKKFPDKTSDYAEEGTLAHSLAALLVNQRIGKPLSLLDFELELLAITKDKYYSHEMLDCIEDFTNYVSAIYHAEKDKGPVTLLIEQKVFFTGFIPDPKGAGFGTIDVQICSPQRLHIVDLKYGKGVKVHALLNSQLMVYSVGSLIEFELIYSPKEIHYHIYQPRIDNVNSAVLSMEHLAQWAHKVLIPRARLAFEGKGEFKPGDHCQFCRAKTRCKALAQHNMALGVYEFSLPDELTDEELVDIFLKAELFTNWINSVKDFALDQAVNHKKQWPGLKTVDGKSFRKWVDETKVKNQLIKIGYKEEQFVEIKLKGFGELEKLIGIKQMEKALGKFIIKQTGKPTLVRSSDKRASRFGLEGAKNDFKELKQL